MIQYIRDLDKSYDAEVASILKSHNSQFTDYASFTSLYVYGIHQGQMIGGLSVSYVWDWVSLGQLYYAHKDVLKMMIHHAWQAYKDKAVGFSFFTTVKERLDDLLEVGFVLDQTVEIDENDTYYYGRLNHAIPINLQEIEWMIDQKAHDTYQSILESKVHEFNKSHHVYDVTASFDMVAKQGDVVVGGIQTDVYHDMLYVNRIAVLSEHRGHKIGSMLMHEAIQYALKHKLKYIMLGTSDFQARGFYEKLGFKVVFQRKDHPRGYHSYTLIKYL